MKKITLMFLLVTAFSMQSDAQIEYHLNQGNLYAFSKTDLLPSNNNQFKSMYSYSKTNPGKDHDFYMRRSKNYRIVGWSTLGAGLVASGIGLLLATNNDAIYNQSKDDAAAVLFLVGAVSGITSIPFMIMASVYKQKARLMISSQPTGFGVPSKVSSNITGITMTIPLGK